MHDDLPSSQDDLGRYLSLMVAHGASDLFLSAGTPAALKVHGVIHRLDEPALTPSRTQQLAYSVMRETQIRISSPRWNATSPLPCQDWGAFA